MRLSLLLRLLSDWGSFRASTIGGLVSTCVSAHRIGTIIRLIPIKHGLLLEGKKGFIAVFEVLIKIELASRAERGHVRGFIFPPQCGPSIVIPPQARC